MGSSCYARGNAKNAILLQEWISAHPDTSLALGGTLCEGHCKDGPVIRLGERLFTAVDALALEEILGDQAGGS